MRLRYRAVIIAAFALISSLAAADEREDRLRADQASSELVELFADLCLARFPDIDQVKALAEGPDTAALAPEDAAPLGLSADALYRRRLTRQGSYRLAVEAGTTCLVTRDYAGAFVYRPYWGLSLRLWALKRGATLTEREAKRVFVGGAPVETVLYALTPSGGGPDERLYSTVGDAPDGGVRVTLVRELASAKP